MTKRILFIAFFLFSLITKEYAQVTFTVTDGSQYLFGNANIDVYYLYTSNGTNGTYGQPATCAMWGCYITIVNKTNNSFNFNANISLGANAGQNCVGSKTFPLQGTVGAKGSKKYRVMPDFWTDINIHPGTPAFNFTKSEFQKAQIIQKSYSNDDIQYTQGAYKLLSQKSGVSVYAAWVTMGGYFYDVCLKVVNNNNYPVLVTWAGVKWTSNGNPIQITSNTEGNFGYSDKFTAGETKDGLYHKAGGVGAAEVYQFRPNYLYYTVPKGKWSSLHIDLPNFQVLQNFK